MTDLVARYLRPGTLHLGQSPPLALYVHLPWCLAKCPYCDFNSHELPALAADEIAPPAAGRAGLEDGEAGSSCELKSQ